MILKIKYNLLGGILFSFILASCNTYVFVPAGSNYSIIRVDSLNARQKDKSMEQLIAPYKNIIDKEMNLIIATSAQELKVGNPEGTLNDFIADLILNESKIFYSKISNENIDMCILNTGGLRANLPQGNISKRHIFELMPFENELVVVTMNGAVVQQMSEYIAQVNGQPISGLNITISNHHAVKILIQNQTLDLTKTYRVVTSDYLSSGGDNMTFFNSSLKTEALKVKVRDAIIMYLMNLSKDTIISVQPDNRIHNE